MFFSSQVIEAIIKDHYQIRSYLEILVNAKVAGRDRRYAFSHLLPHLESHNEREEKALYWFMKSSDDVELRSMAVEGEIKHEIIDRLCQKLKATVQLGPDWYSQAKVLADYVELHINEEENRIFPHLKKYLDTETDLLLLNKYNLKTEDSNPIYTSSSS